MRKCDRLSVKLTPCISAVLQREAGKTDANTVNSLGAVGKTYSEYPAHMGVAA